jgi:hypothetical protein
MLSGTGLYRMDCITAGILEQRTMEPKPAAQTVNCDVSNKVFMDITVTLLKCEKHIYLLCFCSHMSSYGRDKRTK